MEVDVAIVGARVAGSILATMLGEEGVEVLIVDRATFPSATLSTHFFRGAWCAAALRRVGVLDEALAAGSSQGVQRRHDHRRGHGGPAAGPRRGGFRPFGPPGDARRDAGQARKAGTDRSHPRRHIVPASRAMYYRYAVGVAGPEGDPDGAESSMADDELLYVFPSDGDRSCVALSLNLEDYAKAHHRADNAFEERIDAHPFIAEV